MAHKKFTIEDLRKQVFKSKHYGDFIVLDEAPKISGSPHLRRVRIKFLNTNNEITTQICNVFSGNVRDSGNPDPSTPRVYQLKPIDFNKIYNTIYNGQFKIIHDYGYNYPGRKDRIVRIKFIDTGYETDVSLKNISDGYIKDKFKTARNTADNNVYLSFEDKLLYTRWNLLMSRCYDPNNNNYIFYGGMGVRVCDRWHNFDNYKIDVKNIYGYNIFLTNPKKYQLDKDYLQLIVPPYMRIYSPNTCIWLDNYSNCNLLTNKFNTPYNGVVYDTNGFYALIFNPNNCTLLSYGPFNDDLSAARFFNNTLHHPSIASKLPICQSPGEGEIVFRNLNEMCHLIS